MIVARVYTYQALHSMGRYNVLAQLESPVEVVPLVVDEVAREAAQRIAIDQLGGPVKLIDIRDWSASMMTLMTGVQPKCVRAELN